MFESFHFNVNDLPDNDSGFSPVPAGDYQVEIKKVEAKETRNKDGMYFNFRLDILGPTNAGRIIFAIVNVKNASEKAQQIGQGQLKDIMRALNLQSVSNTDQFIGGKLTVKLAIEKSEQYGDSNRVMAFKPIGGSVAPMAVASNVIPGGATAMTPAQPATVGSTPPWG